MTSDSKHDVPSEAQSSTVKRKTRASKRHTGFANQVDSTHEADESESCCSVVSDMEVIPNKQPAHRGRRIATGGAQPDAIKEENVSEIDSCSSSVSGYRGPNIRGAPRTLRKTVLKDCQTGP